MIEHDFAAELKGPAIPARRWRWIAIGLIAAMGGLVLIFVHGGG